MLDRGASITHFLQPQQKYLDLLNWEQISCNPQAELKSIHVFYSINLANLFFCYFFYFSTVTFFPVTFFPVTFFPTSPLLLFFLLLFFLLLFFLLLFFRYFFSCYFLSYNRGGQYQIRGIRVTKDWYFRQYFSIILNSTPMIFHSLWIKCEFTIFDLQLNFLVRFDERKIFESCFLMQNPWHVT